MPNNNLFSDYKDEISAGKIQCDRETTLTSAVNEYSTAQK